MHRVPFFMPYLMSRCDEISIGRYIEIQSEFVCSQFIFLRHPFFGHSFVSFLWSLSFQSGYLDLFFVRVFISKKNCIRQKSPKINLSIFLIIPFHSRMQIQIEINCDRFMQCQISPKLSLDPS